MTDLPTSRPYVLLPWLSLDSLLFCSLLQLGIFLHLYQVLNLATYLCLAEHSVTRKVTHFEADAPKLCHIPVASGSSGNVDFGVGLPQYSGHGASLALSPEAAASTECCVTIADRPETLSAYSTSAQEICSGNPSSTCYQRYIKP